VPAARLAQPADADAVAELLVEFRDWIGRSVPAADGVRASVAVLMADAQTEFLLAGDGPDGICQLRFRHSVWTGTDDCCIEDVFVRESARGNGLGRALVAAALDRARARGCTRVELDTNEENAAALALYGSFGFESRPSEFSGRELLLRLRL
jgi:GNAT superfamily N-acetyltransferase